MKTYPNFIRLSIDEHVFQHHGIYGIDYQPEEVGKLQDEAVRELEVEFRGLIGEGKSDVVLDFSFYDRVSSFFLDLGDDYGGMGLK